MQETDASKRSKLRSQKRKGLIRQSRSNARRNAETEDVRSKAVTRSHVYQSEASQPDYPMSPQNIISGFHESSHMNTILNQSTDQASNVEQMKGIKIGLGQVAAKKDLLSPPSAH